MLIVERNIKNRFEAGELVAGPYQMLMLKLLRSVKRRDPPPKGALTSTGKLRKHLLDDMVSKKLVEIEVPQPGVSYYVITKIGRSMLEEGSATKAPKRAAKLIARQRAKTAARKATKANGRTKRAA